MNKMLKIALDMTNYLLRTDDRTVLVFGSSGVFGMENIDEVKDDCPGRVFDAGIIESEIISMCAGLAIVGMIPVFIAQAPFIVRRACEQLIIDFGYQELGGNFIAYGGSSENGVFGATHCCPDDIGILKQMPTNYTGYDGELAGIQIFVPSSSSEFEQLYLDNYSNGLVSYFRLTRYENSLNIRVKAGKANIIKKGRKATILAVGYMIELALKYLGDEDVTILYYTTVEPFDRQTLSQYITNDRVLLMEPYYYGQLTSDIVDTLKGMKIKIDFVGIPHEYINNYGYVIDNVEHFGFTENQIRNVYRRLVE